VAPSSIKLHLLCFMIGLYIHTHGVSERVVREVIRGKERGATEGTYSRSTL